MKSLLLVSLLLVASFAPALAHPPADEGAKAALETTPRHGEFVDIPLEGGPAIRSFVVYPEKKEKAAEDTPRDPANRDDRQGGEAMMPEGGVET